MKPLLTLLFSLTIALTSFSQNGVYLYGFMENAPAEPIPIDVLLVSDSNLTIGTVMYTEPSGNISSQWIDLPQEFEILWVSAGFTDCTGIYNYQVWDGYAFDNLIDIPINLYFCADSIVYGCTDPESINYNPYATIDDGSCEYPIVCDENQIDVNIQFPGLDHELMWRLINEDGIVVYGGVYTGLNYSHCVPDGCYIFEIYGTYGDSVNGATFEIVLDDNVLASGTFYQGSVGYVAFGINQEDCPEVIYGCTDSLAVNYNPIATHDDGTCSYPTVNDICADALPILPGITLVDNTNAVVNEGVWGECWGFGQGEGEQSSVWYTFTTPDYPARIHLEAIYDGTNTFTDTQFGIFEECGGEMIYCDGNGGEGLMSALNFECGELSESTTYILMIDGWNGDSGTCFLEYAVDSTCTDPIYGCTNPEALTYNPEATEDDGSCQYEIECDQNGVQIIITTQFWGSEISWNLLNADSISVANGNGYENNMEYLSQSCLADGCYTFLMYDTYGDGWNGSSFEVISNGDILASGTLNSGNYGYVNFGLNQEGCVVIPPVYGCTDPEALNYNPAATEDDGSCQYEIECDQNAIQVVISTHSWASEISWELLNADTMSVASGNGYGNNSESLSQWCLADGCYTFLMYDTFGDGWNGSYFEVISNNDTIAYGTLTYGSSGLITFGINQEACFDEVPVFGCTDPESINYNPEATEDDGSCIFDIECTEVTIIIHDYSSTNNEWTLIPLSGFNDTLTGFIDGSFISLDLCLQNGCYRLDPFEAWTNDWDSAFYQVLMNSVTIAHGSLSPSAPGYFAIGTDCDFTEPIFGCTDPNALNYNPDATINNGSCIYDYDCTPVSILIQNYNYGNNEWLLTSSNGNVESGAIPNPSSEITGCLADGCYILEIAGAWSDSIDFGNYTVIVDNEIIAQGSINSFMPGSFEIGAGCDSTNVVYGCTDPGATNYNPYATEDDGSCVYQFECSINFLVIPDSTGESIIWILPSDNIFAVTSILWDFGDGTTSAELFPQHEYSSDGPFTLCVTASFESPDGSSCTITYCAVLSGEMVGGAGFVASDTGFSINVVNSQAPVGIAEPVLFTNINLWPNPTYDQLNIKYHTSINTSLAISIMDITGKTIIQENIGSGAGEFTKAVDVSSLSAGVYLFRLSAEDHLEVKRFVISK